jgi:MFS family permease
MTATVLILAACCAVVAAFRSTWSPCGLSMLSTITPLAERTRGRRWGVTASWFLLGAALGGACLGALAALAAVVVRSVGTSPTAALVGAIVASLGAAAMDCGAIGPELPHHRRQVDERWLDEFRGWVYGIAFGAQIGTGLATYIMTASVYLTVVLAGLTADPLAAIGIGVLFGVGRGLAIFAGCRLTSPERVRAFHVRFESRRAVVRRATIVFELLVAAIAAVAIGGPVAAVIPSVVGVVGIVGLTAKPGRAAHTESTVVSSAATTTSSPAPPPLHDVELIRSGPVRPPRSARGRNHQRWSCGACIARSPVPNPTPSAGPASCPR